MKNWSIVRPIVNLRVRTLCRKPYPNHKDGCPNYNKKSGCPPTAKTIGKLIDLSKPVWAVWNVFNFEQHCSKMKKRHPNWSKKQIECCLYWQPKARKQLKRIVEGFLGQHPHELFIVGNPEGAGVDLTSTMKGIKIELEWPPTTKTYQIVLAGYKNEN